MRRAVWPVTAVVALAVAAFLFGYPTRTFLDQRASLGQEQAVVDRLANQNATLRTQAAQLQTPAEIETLARQQYGLVEPGQEEYAILPSPPAAPRPAGEQTSAAGAAGTSAHDAGARVDGPASGLATSDAGRAGGLWSRLVRQLEFWK